MKNNIFIGLTILLMSFYVEAADPFYVDYNYSSIESINVNHIQFAGYGTGARGLKVGKYYHFKFKDGKIKRFKFVTKYSTMKFRAAGKETSWILTDQDFRDFANNTNDFVSYFDYTGGASAFSLGLNSSGFNRRGRVIIIDFPIREDP